MKFKNKGERRVDKGGDRNGEAVKKPFDKKKFREQKYSHKFKVKQHEERRIKAIKRSFFKEIKAEEKGAGPSNSDTSEGTKKPKLKLSYEEQVKRNQEIKRKKKEEILKAKQEKEEAIKKYKEKRIQKHKMLSQKTRKGQPVMKGRLELLLQKIEQKVGSERN